MNVARWRSSVFPRTVLAVMAAVSIPATARGGAFSRAAVSIRGGGARTISSPDGTKAILIRPPRIPGSDENHEVVVRAYGREHRTTAGALVNAEVAWAPDSTAFFVTYSEGGNVGTYHVKLVHVTASGLAVTEPIPEGRKLGAPTCVDVESPNVGAVRWTGRGSRRLLVAVQVPPHSSCADMGTFSLFEIELPRARVIKKWSQLDGKKRFGTSLGDALLNADDGCVMRPGTCVPHAAVP
jgi:hypothetical protein